MTHPIREIETLLGLPDLKWKRLNFHNGKSQSISTYSDLGIVVYYDEFGTPTAKWTWSISFPVRLTGETSFRPASIYSPVYYSTPRKARTAVREHLHANGY